MEGPVCEEDVRILVSARIRPSLQSTQTCINVNNATQSICLHNGDNEQKEFEFDNVLGAKVTQAEVFEKVGKKIVNGCLEGYNGALLAYGQTNSGKTYTMQGVDFDDSNYEHGKGIMPRAVEYLFQELESKKDESNRHFNFQVQCSFVELYNEQIFDLINPQKQPKLRLNGQRAQLENTRVESINSYEDILPILKTGIGNRRAAETRANRQSSRSHSILILHVETEDYEVGGDSGENAVLIRKSSQLNFVDLAGSERLSYSKSERQQMKEAIHINKSLTTLGRVIRALSKNWPHVPYRDSILTQFLAHSLNSRTAFIVTLHPDKKQFDTTASSLQFSQTLRTIKHKIWVNQESVPYTTNTHNSFVALEKDPELGETSQVFESIEELTKNLDQIEQKKREYLSSFNELSLRETEITQKLDAYKNGTFDSAVLCESFMDKLNSSEQSSIKRTMSNNSRKSRRRRTIFGLSSDLLNSRSSLASNSPFHSATIDFQDIKCSDQQIDPKINFIPEKELNVSIIESTQKLNELMNAITNPGKQISETIILDETENSNQNASKNSINDDHHVTIIDSENFRIFETPKSRNATRNEDVSLLKTPSPLKNEENKENQQRSQIPVKNREMKGKFEGLKINIDDIIKPARILESQAISQTQKPVNEIRPIILESQAITPIPNSPMEGNETDSFFSNRLSTLEESNVLQEIDQQSENSSPESISDVSEISEEKIEDLRKNNKIIKFSPMILRRKSLAKRRLANQFRSNRRHTMSLENREAIVQIIREFKDEIFNFGISQARRQQIWAQICQVYSTKFPDQEKIDVKRMRQTWTNLRKRALKVENESKKMTHVDRLVLSIIQEVESNRQSSSSNPTKKAKNPKKDLANNLLYTQLLLKQGEFVQKMMELKLVPVFFNSKIAYRQMRGGELENIELPKDFVPTDEMLKLLEDTKTTWTEPL